MYHVIKAGTLFENSPSQDMLDVVVGSVVDLSVGERCLEDYYPLGWHNKEIPQACIYYQCLFGPGSAGGTLINVPM